MIDRVAWILPVISACAWLGMLLGLVLHWVTIGKPIYQSMTDGQTIAYISDVGAYELKPLFIAGSATMVATLNAGMCCERWLRHKGKLKPTTSKWQNFFDIMAIFSAMVGGLGLIFLTIFDTVQYPTVHDDLLAVFVGGYIASAVFIITEYQRLGMKYRQHFVLRLSFWLKLVFGLVELALAIPFGILETTSDHQNAAARIEWTLAFFFTLYILTFVVDLMPALRTSHHVSQESLTEMAYKEGNASSSSAVADQPPQLPVLPSNNFWNTYRS